MKLKPGKYVGKTLTPEQKEAQRIPAKALKMEVKLAEFLSTNLNDWDREKAHKRLDWYLDAIDKKRQRAQALFPEVEESSVIAYGYMKV